MSGRVEGKVAFVSGAARGQGRSHAVRLAEEGASIIAFDLCRQIETVAYPMSTPADLAATTRLVGEAGGRILAREADARDLTAVAAVLDEGVAEFGRLDLVVANHGTMNFVGPDDGDTMEAWTDSLDTMLTGVYHMLRASVPLLINQGAGGSIVLTSSTAGIKPRTGWTAGSLGYTAAKAGLIGLMRHTALRLGKHSIRCNTVHPTGVETPMIRNDAFDDYVSRNHEFVDAMQNALPVTAIEPIDVTNLVLFLCSDESRYLTGETLSVDAGYLIA